MMIKKNRKNLLKKYKYKNKKNQIHLAKKMIKKNNNILKTYLKVNKMNNLQK